ncbi:MAG: DUF2243 domain-containing protein [Thermomicrobiaceae bacterium]
MTSGILFGLGLGGFFDGIILHQVLRWHHMVSSTETYSPASLANLEINVLADGLFHIATYVFVLAGLVVLWRVLDHRPMPWTTKGFIGLVILGFGLFNVVEGFINHQLLGIHHVNETVPESYWIYWDAGFLIWGALMIALGWWLWRSGWASASHRYELDVRMAEK